MNLKELKEKSPADLLAYAEELEIENASSLRKQDMMFAILKTLAENDVAIFGDGVLEVLQDGFGFLRSPEANYLPGPDDIYVSPSQVRRFSLRTGDTVEGQIRSPKDGERYFALLKVNEINFGHLNASPENLDRLARAGIKKILVHLRDPRQTTLSWAHYMEEGAVARHGRRLYERIVSSDITPVSMLDAPFAEKLDWYAEHIFPRFMEWILGWIRVRDTDRRFDVRVMEFRQLKEQPLAYMQEAAAFFGVPREINRVAAPRQGVANFRAGQMDEWRQAFNPGQIDRMTRQIPETIAAEAGWELPR